LQDIVAPGLKSLPEHVAALENRSSLTSIVEMNGTIKDRFSEVGRQAEKRHAQILNYLSLDARIRRLEGRRQTEHQ
jgi:hypothetical protein